MGKLSRVKSRRDGKKGKTSRVSYMTEVMKPEIWEKFPEDLFEVVLARLPIAKIICFRTVCQQWNNLITSQRFSQHCAQVSQVNLWFYITYGYDNCKTMYDPFMKRWYNPTTFETPTFPVSSAGGLVCFADSRYLNPNLYVCNPITQSFKKLPIGSIEMWRLLGMTMNRSAGYRVLKMGFNRKYEIYDSVTKCWNYLGKVPKYADFTISNNVSIDNTLYFKHEDPDSIISCDTSTGVWTQHSIQAPLHSSDLTLAESNGRIMLVGLVRENYGKCVCIWEVQKMTFMLKEVDRKTIQYSGFNSKSVDLSCLEIKGLLLCYLKSYDKYRMITYNISTRKWVQVPVPFRYNCLRVTAFQPSLSAMP